MDERKRNNWLDITKKIVIIQIHWISYKTWKFSLENRKLLSIKKKSAKLVDSLSYIVWRWREKNEYCWVEKKSQQNWSTHFHTKYKNLARKSKTGEYKKKPSKMVDSLSYIIWRWRKENEYCWVEKMSQQIDWLISRYIWDKLYVCESDITFFVQIRLTQEWSSFSRMMLWWSDCSASMTMLKIVV